MDAHSTCSHARRSARVTKPSETLLVISAASLLPWKRVANQASPSQLENALKTAVLELTQGAKSTVGSYAEYVRLAEEYAAGDRMH